MDSVFYIIFSLELLLFINTLKWKIKQINYIIKYIYQSSTIKYKLNVYELSSYVKCKSKLVMSKIIYNNN